MRDLQWNFRRGQGRPSSFSSLVNRGRVRAAIVASSFFLAFLLGPPLQGESAVRTITIAWNASAGEGISGYRLLYGTRSGQYSQVIDAGNQTSCEVPNLMDGTTYFFAVVAYTADGFESPASDELMHTPNPGMFLNISTRARVQDGDAVMISGFIIGGSSRKTVIIRALGPSLAGAGVSDVLSDPAIELHGPDGVIATNDNWRDGNPDALDRFRFAPAADAEAALVTALPPGAYSVVVRSANGSSGIALLEVYDGGIPVAP